MEWRGRRCGLRTGRRTGLGWDRLLIAVLFPLADPLVLPHRHLAAAAAAAAALGSGGSGGGVAGGAASWSGCRCRGSVPPRARPRSACVRSARGVGMEGRARGERGRVRRRRRGRRHREGGGGVRGRRVARESGGGGVIDGKGRRGDMAASRTNTIAGTQGGYIALR